jgi:putative adenylate-forming enzyme
MLKHFDEMNTAELKIKDIFNLALSAEKERDFSTKLNGFTVGLSSGTSGQRGVFVVSNKENAMWSGIILAKILPNLFSIKNIINKQKVAFFLRANSNLYKSLNSPWLKFEFFDLFTSIDINLQKLVSYNPTVLIAPAQVLRYIALKKISGDININPVKIISVAEVLTEQDKKIIREAFFNNQTSHSLESNLHQVYQATEGLLATTCKFGNLHLNEKYVHIKPFWLDENNTQDNSTKLNKRFNPIITDFTRITQPMINYHLNDVLVMADKPCACGDVSHMIECIEGRNDDILWLPSINENENGNDINQEKIPVFSDMLSRSIAKYAPLNADYQIVQVGEFAIDIAMDIDENILQEIQKNIALDLEKIGVCTRNIAWNLHTKISTDFTQKRRRIINLAGKK